MAKKNEKALPEADYQIEIEGALWERRFPDRESVRSMGTRFLCEGFIIRIFNHGRPITDPRDNPMLQR